MQGHTECCLAEIECMVIKRIAFVPGPPALLQPGTELAEPQLEAGVGGPVER